MGIKDWFSSRQVTEIERLNSLGYNDSDIAKEMNLSYHRVNRFRKGVGLPKNAFCTLMSAKRRGATARESLRKNTGDFMNYRNAAHVFYAMSVGWPDYKLGEALILYVLQRSDGSLETPELICQINFKKGLEGWKPVTSVRMFYHYAASLRGAGMIDRLYPRERNWRTGSRSYCLTDLAYESMRGVDGRIIFDE